MNPFQYRLGQITKAAVSAVLFAFVILGFFVAYDPNLPQAVVVSLLALSTVISVFLKPNASVGDVTKAVEQLKGAVLTAVGFIVTVPASVEMQIAAAVAALLSFYPIWKLRNAHPPTVVEDEIEETVPEPPAVVEHPPGEGLPVEGDRPAADVPLDREESEEARQARHEGVPPTRGTVE